MIRDQTHFTVHQKLRPLYRFLAVVTYGWVVIGLLIEMIDSIISETDNLWGDLT